MSYQERIPPYFYELKITSKDEQCSKLVRVVFSSLGVDAHRLSEEIQKGQIVLKIFSEDATEIARLHGLFKRIKLSGVITRQQQLLPKDWLTRWKVGWKPAHLTRKLDVVPVWFKDKYRCPKGRDYILMDTLLSFGTGLHETTQIVSQFVENYQGQFKSFLDIGTGTGILALVALKSGAASVKAIDIGDLSVEAARHNFEVNKVHGTIVKADISKYKDARQYDFVAANLITHDLIDHSPSIVRLVRPGGWLAISGISLDNLVKLRRVFKTLPLTCLKVEKGRQWSGLLYQKKMS